MQQTRELLGLSDEPSGSVVQPLRAHVHQMEKSEVGGAEFSSCCMSMPIAERQAVMVEVRRTLLMAPRAVQWVKLLAIRFSRPGIQ